VACTNIEQEVGVGARRPDLLATTTCGVGVAIEIAYSSFCDPEKRQDYENLQLPALEIDLRAFTPSAFDVAEVRRVIVEDVARKVWLWPECLQANESVAPQPVALAAHRPFLPEQIVTIRGRWISIKILPSGDIAMKAVRFDPEIVSIVRMVAKTHFGRYREAHHNWIIPRHRAEAARAQLLEIAAGM
jgi:competence protein CoiA